MRLPPGRWFRHLVVWCALLFLGVAAHAASGATPSEILVKYREGASPGKVGRDIGHRVVAIRVADDSALPERRARLLRHLDTLRADPAIEYAEPNYHGHFDDLPQAVSLPGDPDYPSQWWLDAIGARRAWAVATGKGVSVAVIDSGVDFNHPDLKDALRGDGYNFGDGNATPQDTIGHGTFVAGILAARCGNAVAGCGLAPEASILPIKINPGSLNDFDSAALAQGIDYAVARGAGVVNLSVSVAEETRTVGEAIQRALDAGVVVVAATGNKGGAVAFPGTYPGVVAVAGSNRDGTLWSGSNRGVEVTLAAPAVEVNSTLLGGGFGTRSQGTSYATPMVAAAIAAIRQVDYRFDRGRIKALLRAMAQPLATSGQGFGILDAGQALLALLPDLVSEKREYADGDSLRLEYRLPPTGGPVDIYVAIAMPSGDWSLYPDGRWFPVAQQGYAPVGSAYSGVAASSGTLFGSGGVFPAIKLDGLPTGQYVWRAALVDRQAAKTIGPVVATPVTVK